MVARSCLEGGRGGGRGGEGERGGGEGGGGAKKRGWIASANYSLLISLKFAFPLIS